MTVHEGGVKLRDNELDPSYHGEEIESGTSNKKFTRRLFDIGAFGLGFAQKGIRSSWAAWITEGYLNALN